MKKIKISINIEHEMNDDQYEEDFSDLEVLVNLLDDIRYGWDVKVEYK